MRLKLITLFLFSLILYGCEEKKGNADFIVSENVVLGNVALMNNEFESAKFFYQKAIADNPNDYLALNNLGELFGLIGIYDSALYFFNESLKVDSLNARTYNNRAELYEIVHQKKNIQHHNV